MIEKRIQKLFLREENTIRLQVQAGRRCSQCLRPFNAGERKCFSAGSNQLICQRCHLRAHLAVPRPVMGIGD